MKFTNQNIIRKMKIKIYDHFDRELPKVIKKGEWIDLSIPYSIELFGPEAKMLKRIRTKGEDNRTRDVEFHTEFIDLGYVIKVPKGYEVHVLPRSSTFNKYGIVLSNSMGIIDNDYNGIDDKIKAYIIPFKHVNISEDTRLFQFRVELSQNATFWQKIKWLFSNKIEVETFTPEDKNRGGFGSTGETTFTEC